MIPNLDWWPVSNPFNGQPMLAFSTVTENQFYGIKQTFPDRKELAGCVASNWSYICPGAGFSELYVWAAAFENVGTGPNITMTEPLGGAQRQLLSSYVQVDDSNVSIAITHHHSILQMTGLFWDHVSRHGIGNNGDIQRPLLSPNNNSEVRAAVVQVQCDMLDYQDARAGNVTVEWPTSALNNFSKAAYPKAGWKVDQNLWNFERPLNMSNFTWVDFSTPDKGASLGAMVTLPHMVYDGVTEGPSGNLIFEDATQRSLLIPCTIDARWAATDLTCDPTNGNQIGTNLTDPSIFARRDTASDQMEELHVLPAALIDLTWAAMLDAPGIEAAYHSLEVHNTTMMLALLDTFIALNVSKDSSHTNNFYPAENAAVIGDKAALINTVSTVLSLEVAEVGPMFTSVVHRASRLDSDSAIGFKPQRLRFRLPCNSARQ